ncbi:glycosyltransferase family 39 protein [Acetobacteraceae bacterium]|nr:glycosyltransferase family 39 protein [Candidatus Parcubacteria bacterium]
MAPIFSSFARKIKQVLLFLAPLNTFEIALFLIAIAGSALVYFATLHFNPVLIKDIDWEFLRLATNLREYGVYADSSDPSAFHLSSGYTPLYPLLLVPFVYHYTLMLVLNWVLHALIIVFTYRLAIRLGAHAGVSFVACALFALEPYHLNLTNQIMSEMLFGLLLLFAVHSALTYLQEKRFLYLGVASLLLGLSTLTRPSAEFLIPAILIIPFFTLGVSRRAILHGLAGVCICVLVLLPWLLRNYYFYHAFSLSSLTTQQLISAGIPQYLEWKEKGAAATEKSIYERRYALYREAEKYLGYHPQKPLELNIVDRIVDFNEARIINQHMVWPLLKTDGLSMFGFYLTQLPFQLMTDNWRTALDNILHLPYTQTTSLSAALAAVRGDFSQILTTFKSVDPYLFAFLAGKIYWLVAYLLGAFGAYVLWRRGGTVRLAAIGLVLLAIYFPLVSLPYLESRYRFPATPFIFTLVSIGASVISVWIAQKVQRVRHR